MIASYVQRGEYIDFVPVADVHAGDVIVQGKFVGVSKLDIAAGKLGAIATGGVFDLLKGNEAIAVGAPVYFNAADKVATASADNGATGDDKVEYAYLGLAIASAGAGDASVRVLLNAVKS